MATKAGAGATKPAGRTTARRSATTTARRSAATKATARKSRSGSAGLAERAVLVPMGAGLRAQESLVSTVKGIASRYGTRASLLRELDRCETRGATARTDVQRQLHRTRSQLETQVRSVRRDLEERIGTRR